MYVDDTQLYYSYTTGTKQSMDNRFNDCMAEISNWMAHSRLKLNDSKTETITIGRNTEPNNVKNLGAYLANAMSCIPQAGSVVSKCMYAIRNIAHIRQFLDHTNDHSRSGHIDSGWKQ